MVFDSFFNKIFGFLIKWNPFWALIILSLIITFLITLIYKFFTNQKEIKTMKDELKEIQKELKESKEDPQKSMELQKKVMEKNLKYMFQSSFRPMLITFIPIIIIFTWLSATYKNISLPLGWIWIYIIVSIIFSTILRKLLKVH